jgi:acetyltransferase-like isoleucine patch superfamily enzyme
MEKELTGIRLAEAPAVLPPPTWDLTNHHSFTRGLYVLSLKLRSAALYYLACKGNKVTYLRHLGARVGEDCEILTNASNLGTEPWLVQIGNRVTIAQGVVFLTHDGANRVFRHCLAESSKWGNRFGPIRVLDNSFVGANSILMPGVSIGPSGIVGTASVVTRDVPPRTVVAGVPARPICSLDEYIERYKSKMIPITARSRKELRRELTLRFWGEER